MYVEYFLINSVLNVQERTKCAQGENRCENDASSFFIIFLCIISCECLALLVDVAFECVCVFVLYFVWVEECRIR